ncbi:ribosome recycling factor family protein [Vibrio methylphosphonaticus]|uniref:ribosome recycling factor family protein n=1 Tax=Vibrio methylphosphonaticus TaxID=2946866 RepID=UPI00202A6BDB|nr:ribosome recycling factor family protein [Vibrio methylphosphonaticus]MCL9774916.1 ribosome recycling factor family protein [Vibrio methylphosphonaticus]
MEKSRLLVTIRLNSFVHRVDDKQRLIELAGSLKCQLKRIRRSRNWTLIGQPQSLTRFALESDVGWIAVAVDKVLAEYKSPIQQVLEKNPDVTVAELMHESGCTLKEARKAIDDHEGL